MTVPAPFDLTAGLILLVLALYGMAKGIVRLVMNFAGLALAWALAVRWCEPLALWIGASRRAAEIGPDVRRLLAFGLIFAGVALGTALVASLITRALSGSSLGGLNRLAGAGLGLLAGIVLLSAATIPLIAMWPPDGGPLVRGSTLAPYAVAGGGYLKDLAPVAMRERFTAGARKVLSGPAAPSPAPGLNEPTPAPAPRPR